MTDPILKWAGGKRWLVANDGLPKPEVFSRYVEPFLGGGAVFFYLNPGQALLSDTNADLINLYQIVRDFPQELEALLQVHQDSHGVEHYYNVRRAMPVDPIASAARFLYLNRTCWNGLYRVNLKGEFNVPIGTKQAVVLENDDFLALSSLLRKVEIECCDFEITIDQCCEGDFLFVDPPYTVQHNYNGFLKYNEKIFSWDDQIRLRDSLVRAASRGASIVLTNADHGSIRDLYEASFSYQAIARHSVLSGKAAGRKATTEAIFTCNL